MKKSHKHKPEHTDNPCIHNVNNKSGMNINAVVCDLDGTLLYPRKEAIAVKGRTGISFLGKDAASLLAKISRVFPLVIATGRNAVSTARLVKQLPDVVFSGFVLENGFVVKQNIYDTVSYDTAGYDAAGYDTAGYDAADYDTADYDAVGYDAVGYDAAGYDAVGYDAADYDAAGYDAAGYDAADYDAVGYDVINYNTKWEKIAQFFPDWERLPFYENCTGFIPPSTQMDNAKKTAEIILKENGYNDLVYKENKKIFIYPGIVNKMRGLSILGVHPYIAMGDQINDIQMIQESSWPVVPDSGVAELKTIVKQKKGFCSLLTSHEAAHEMLDFAYKKISEGFA